MLKDHRIIGIHLTDRLKNAVELQAALTLHGGCIKTRLGLHEPQNTPGGSPNGVVILEATGSNTEVDALRDALKKVHGVEIQEIRFTH